MNTSKVIHQAKLNSWADSIREQQSSSLSVSKWCELHHISKTQFYYWKRQLADQFVESQLPEIVPISVPVPDMSCTTFKSFTKDTNISEPSVLKITIGDISIDINNSTSIDLLAQVIKVVRHV